MGQFLRIMLLTSVLVVTGALVAVAQPPAPSKPKPAPAASGHKMVTPDQVKWGPAPPSLPPGAQLAVLDGDPGKTGFFTIRGKFPDGYVVPPHWHPTDEHVVVLSGTLMMGTGDKAEPSAMHALPSGSFSRIPKTVHHFVQAKGETIIQVSGMGPFVVNYVNPSDDPRKKSGTE
jgi:quercetin dioxygenase-like cupin family protein